MSSRFEIDSEFTPDCEPHAAIRKAISARRNDQTYCRLEIEPKKISEGTHTVVVNFFDANSKHKKTLFEYRVSLEMVKLEATVEKCHKM